MVGRKIGNMVGRKIGDMVGRKIGEYETNWWFIK